MRFVLVLLVGLVLAETAAAAEPGFRYSKALTVRAAKIAPGSVAAPSYEVVSHLPVVG
jgi:hypothetical protein